jgi:two-component system, chemotaxis family, chemotaxis protein CheY
MTFTGKILLVDDEAHVRKFLDLVVRGLGTPIIIEAATGEEALVKYAAESPDLVLLDVNLPMMNGLQILAAILKQDPKAQVVMLTSMANRQTIKECLKIGAVGYLRKDIPKEAILAELAALVCDRPKPADPPTPCPNETQ